MTDDDTVDRESVTGFHEELVEALDADPDAWGYFPRADGYEAVVWFRGPEPKIEWRDIAVLRELYGVHSIRSESRGRTGSQLAVHLSEVR